MRNEKSYTGDLMKVGKSNEEIILEWLKNNYKGVLDFRDIRLVQRADIDCGVETADGKIILAEIKSDKWISESGNFCFENHRINHFVKDKWFYLGWGYRSPAQFLIVRNPDSRETFIFDFSELRKSVGGHIANVGKNLRIAIVETDKQKTTFNYLIPMPVLKYKKFII